MKIGFAARFSPLDKRSWSGTTHYTYQQIKKNYEVEIFNYKWTWRVREWLTMQKSLNRKLFKKHTVVEFLKNYAKFFSKQLENDLKRRPVDVLFVSASSQMIAYLETAIPVIYMTDATFRQLQGYYSYFSNLPAYNLRQGIELDRKAFLKTAHCMLASEWCKNSAVNDYGVDPNKISVIPCGANLDAIPQLSDLNLNAPGQCRLLFLGVEWDRKGGDIALETFRLLKEKGINPHLHIIGCVPPHDLSAESAITVIPFLDKNDPAQFQQLQQIFFQTDILLLPTRAECAGVVFSESSAYGIPSITTNTGGVSTYVKDGINGFALPVEANADAYANKIGQLVSDQQAIQNLKLSSRKHYEEKLNWDLWGQQFAAIAEQLVRH
ncbi:MAG: glycosyltransferase family 4 protein [Chitinophagaceae bacterium]|nr:glycosyltransferase family 4 protein [Chitinophagaceae bacterium]